jgi:hypothetical protein
MGYQIAVATGLVWGLIACDTSESLFVCFVPGHEPTHLFSATTTLLPRNHPDPFAPIRNLSRQDGGHLKTVSLPKNCYTSAFDLI